MRSKINSFQYCMLQFGLRTLIVGQTYWPFLLLLLDQFWMIYWLVSSLSLSFEVSHLFTALLRPSVVWYSDVLVVVAAVMRRVQVVGGLRGQAGAQRFMAAQHGCEILGLLRQLLHLLPQSSVLLFQVLALQVKAVSFLSLSHPALLSSNPVLLPPHHLLRIVWGTRPASRWWRLVTCVIAVRALSHSQPRRLKPCVFVHFCFVFLSVCVCVCERALN